MPIEIRNSRGVYVVPSGEDVIFVSAFCRSTEWRVNDQFSTLRDLLLAGF